MTVNSRRIGLALLFAATLARRVAAQPAVDVRDLPPLPSDVAAEASERIAVVAATRADEETVVGAAKREQSLGSVASAVTVIPGDRLRRFGYRTLSEALRAVAGMYVIDDRYTQRLGIRGLQIEGDFNTRILVLIDGATISEPWNQFTGIGADMPVELDDVARVEIVRGPVGSLYGTNAFFGIINIVTRNAGETPRAYGRTTLSSFGGGGGNVGLAIGNVHRQLRATFSYETRGNETLTVPQFQQDGASATTSADGQDAWNASVVGRFEGAFVQVRAYRKERELTGAPYMAVPGASRNRASDAQISSELGYSRDVGDRVTMTVRGYLNRYHYEDYLVYEPMPNFIDFGDSTWYGGEARAHVKLLDRGRLGLTFGGEVTFDDVKSESFNEGMRDMGVQVPTSFDLRAGYAEAEATPLDWMSLVAGVRIDDNSIFQSHVSPRGALLLHHADDYGFKFLYAEGFRYPSPFEAFFADNISYIANPGLRPETIRSFEGVLWMRPLRGMSARVSGFRWDMQDLLQQQAVDTPDGSRLQFQNAFQLTSTGGEVEGFYRNTRGWMGFASMTYASVERVNLDGSSQSAFDAPSVIASGGVSTPLVLRTFHVSTELLYVSDRPTRDPSVRADAWLGWNVVLHAPSIAGCDATVGVRNLLGTREQVPVSQDFDRQNGMLPIYTLPGEAREFFARVGYAY